MICPSCGNQVEEGVRFCPHCGNKIDPIESMLKEAEAPQETEPVTRSMPDEAAPPEEPVQAAPAPAAEKAAAKSSGNAKRIGIALGIIAAVIIALFVGRSILNKMHEKAYNEARKLLVAENYEDAKKEFEELGEYKDSQSQADYCQQCIDYRDAQKLLEDGAYEEAQKAFEELGDFKESAANAAHCADLIQYEEAEKLFKDKKYNEARAIYEKLPFATESGFDNASEHLTYCRNIEKYNDACEILKKKQYYNAYKAFQALGDFKNSKKKMESCKKTFPSTGETYRNPKYAAKSVSLKIVPPSNGTYNYMKFYSGKTLVSCVAIGKNSQATVVLPVGSYTIKNAYSSGDWFGADDMFGDNGTYIKLMNGSKDSFKLEANMIYTLTLRSSTATGGNSVGSQSENRANF